MSYRDAGENYFQTTDDLATSERKKGKSLNKYGKPIKLPSKLLAAHVDPFNHGAVYVAEGAGTIKRVILETGDKTTVIKGSAPFTCIAFSSNGRDLCTGCWDKNIYRKDLSNGKTSILSGHSDFVKCLLATSINGTPILISGGADASIIVWDLSNDRQLYKLKGHTKSLQDLQIDPTSWPSDRADPLDSLIIFSASSDREIRHWTIRLDGGSEIQQNTILAHDTSIWKFVFDSEGDIWTASADKTAKHLVRSRQWTADTTLTHPDYVKDVVVAETLGLVATACRDEEVRIWDLATGKLLCIYSGHYEEVSSLLLIDKTVVSASLDGTIRQWSLNRAEMARFTDELAKEPSAQAAPSIQLTAEEDAELEALMDSDDD